MPDNSKASAPQFDVRGHRWGDVPSAIRGETWAVIPVKAFSEGKSRLAGALSTAEREALNRQLFQHTLDAVLGSFVDVALVISHAPEVLDEADALGAAVLRETLPEQGLNGALDQAAAAAKYHGAKALITLSADLPWVQSEDIDALGENSATIPKPQASVAIAPDRHGTGTNAIYQRPLGLVRFEYGTDSFERHRQCVDNISSPSVSLRIVKRRGLQFDVDTERDLEELRHPEKSHEGYRSATCPGA